MTMMMETEVEVEVERRVLVAQEMGVQADKAVQEEMEVDEAAARLVAVLVARLVVQVEVEVEVEAMARAATVTSSQMIWKTMTVTLDWATMATTALS